MKNQLSKCLDLLNFYTKMGPNDPCGWQEYGKFLLQHFPFNKRLIVQVYSTLIELDPMSSDAFNYLVDHYQSECTLFILS